MKTNMLITKFLQATFLLVMTVFSGLLQAEDQSASANKIESVDVSSLPGGRVSISVKTTQPLANPPRRFFTGQSGKNCLGFSARREWHG